MIRRERHRLIDISAAVTAIRSHLARGDLADGLVFDAVRMRVIEIGEAVKTIPPEMLNRHPEVAWSEIARMRDHLAHRYFDTMHAIVEQTVAHDLQPLDRAVTALLVDLDPTGD